jgi:perosamine synthetase
MDTNLLISKEATIRDAMECINKSGKRSAFIVDSDNKFIGLVTDGDIRRALLAGNDFSSSVIKIANLKPLTVKDNILKNDYLSIMKNNKVYELPVVDDSGILKNVIFLSNLQGITLSKPDITQKEYDAVIEVLNSSILSIGPKVKEFEKKVAEYVGAEYAIAVNSGTSALHLCVRSLDIKDGDEIITSPFSFIASANCALFERAKPVFVDIDPNTLCIDVAKIEEKITEKTKAILPVHIFGHPCEMDAILAIAKKHNLAVIEDACEALGTEYKGKKVGSLGDCGVFAFYPNKQITTSEGGIVVTNDKKIADLCMSMRNQGRDEGEGWLNHKRLGFNYRMGELSAALGGVQMDRIEEILKKRQNVADLYKEGLKNIQGITAPYIGPDVKMSWFVYVIRLDSNIFSKVDRDNIIEKMSEGGISCKNYFPPIHLESFYKEMFNYQIGDFPVTEHVSNSTIALPFYNNLESRDITHICDSLKRLLSRNV